MAVPLALTIAGSDSGGGAGIQADIKTFSALGVYGASAITAVTAQNTLGVQAIEEVGTSLVKQQIISVINDLQPKVVKIGMLSSAGIVETVADQLKGFRGIVVLDPVMIAKSGDALLQDEAVEALITCLIPRADLITPNLHEAARLIGCPVAVSVLEQTAQARQLLAYGADVLLKGGHADGPECIDILQMRNGNFRKLSAPRCSTGNTHGTGCTLSAAVAAFLAAGKTMEEAVSLAHGYVQKAIVAADGLHVGAGSGPVHHFHAQWP